MTTDNSNLELDTPPNMPEGYFDESKLFEDDGGVVNQDEPIVNDVATTNDDNDFIRISRKELAKEIERLRIEDSDFAQVYNRDIGNKAAQRYKPQIDSLSKQNDALALAIRQQEYRALTQEEVNAKFTTDPSFAKDYADVIHAPAPNLNTAPDVNAISAEAQSFVTSTLSMAEQLLPQDKYEAIKAELAAGKYDADESGEPYHITQWREGAERLRADIVRASRTEVITTPTPQVVTPSRTDSATPDLSNGGGRGTQVQRFTIQQVREMDIEEKLRRWPNEGDFERAVDAGQVQLSS